MKNLENQLRTKTSLPPINARNVKEAKYHKDIYMGKIHRNYKYCEGS
jgi:hypothetical protein